MIKTLYCNHDHNKKYQGHNQEEYFGEGAFVPYQKALWDLFEKPQGGIAAKVSLFKLFEYVIRSLFVGHQNWKPTKAPSVRIMFVHILRLLLVVDKGNKELVNKVNQELVKVDKGNKELVRRPKECLSSTA